MACTLAHTRGSICFSSPQVLTLYVYKRIFGWSHQSFWISQFCRQNMTYLCVCRCVCVLCVCQDWRCSNIFLRVVGQADLHVWSMTGISPFLQRTLLSLGGDVVLEDLETCCGGAHFIVWYCFRCAEVTEKREALITSMSKGERAWIFFAFLISKWSISVLNLCHHTGLIQSFILGNLLDLLLECRPQVLRGDLMCVGVCFRWWESSRVPYHQGAGQAEGRQQLAAASEWLPDWNQGWESQGQAEGRQQLDAAAEWPSGPRRGGEAVVKARRACSDYQILIWVDKNKAALHSVQVGRIKKLPAEWRRRTDQSGLTTSQIHPAAHKVWGWKVNVTHEPAQLLKTCQNTQSL